MFASSTRGPNCAARGEGLARFAQMRRTPPTLVCPIGDPHSDVAVIRQVPRALRANESQPDE